MSVFYEFKKHKALYKREDLNTAVPKNKRIISKIRFSAGFLVKMNFSVSRRVNAIYLIALFLDYLKGSNILFGNKDNFYNFSSFSSILE